MTKTKLKETLKTMKKITSEKKLWNKYKDTKYEDIMDIELIRAEKHRNISYNQALHDVSKLL